MLLGHLRELAARERLHERRDHASLDHRLTAGRVRGQREAPEGVLLRLDAMVIQAVLEQLDERRHATCHRRLTLHLRIVHR